MFPPPGQLLLSPKLWAGCCLLFPPLSAPTTPAGCVLSCLGAVPRPVPGETHAPGTREALTDHLVTECSSKHKPAFLFRWLGTSILRLKGKPLNVVVFFQGVSTAFTTQCGFLGRTFYVLTTFAGASIGRSWSRSVRVLAASSAFIGEESHQNHTQLCPEARSVSSFPGSCPPLVWRTAFVQCACPPNSCA